MVSEAALAQTEAGLVPAGEGWFVLNAREARWNDRPGRGHSLPFTGLTDFAGGGDGECVVLAIGSREKQASGPWGAYTVDEVALRHGAGVEEETQNAELAYARFPKIEPTRYRDGWLPG